VGVAGSGELMKSFSGNLDGAQGLPAQMEHHALADGVGCGGFASVHGFCQRTLNSSVRHFLVDESSPRSDS